VTGSDLDRPVGVLHAAGEIKFKDFLRPCLAAAFFGGGGAALILRATDVSDRIDAMGDLLPLGGGLLAVVFGALAIVVSLPSMSYLRMLEETPEGGMGRFLDPFLVAAAVQVTVVILALVYRAVAGHLPWQIEHAAFYVAGAVFVFGILEIFALARQLVQHGIYRAIDATLPDEQPKTGEGSVQHLSDRRA
jgi:hypothetical protein